jgi:hypothetical protein
MTGRNPREAIHVGPSIDASWQKHWHLQLDFRKFTMRLVWLISLKLFAVFFPPSIIPRTPRITKQCSKFKLWLHAIFYLTSRCYITEDRKLNTRRRENLSFHVFHKFGLQRGGGAHECYVMFSRNCVLRPDYNAILQGLVVCCRWVVTLSVCRDAAGWVGPLCFLASCERWLQVNPSVTLL